MLFSRILIISVKYGTYSVEHFDILRKVRLDIAFLSSQLVASQANNPEADFHLDNINEIIESMEIDEHIFKILLYKD